MSGNQVRVGVGVTGAKGASSELDQLRDKFTKLQSQGAKGLAIGAGAAVAAKALNLVGEAIGGVTGEIGDSINAYRQQEAASGRLTASLRANVVGWDGSTAAIRDATDAGIKLGFTEIDTTNALALLVAATHDETEAIKILGVAQDLARFKQISLSDASAALTSIEAGRSRGLAQLGINVKNYATTEERLAAVEKVVGGQAREYASSDLGQVDVATAKVDQAQEKLGKGMSHLSAVILPAAADAIDTVATALTDLGHASDADATIAANVGTVIATNTTAGFQTARAAIDKGIADLQKDKLTVPLWGLLAGGQTDQQIAFLRGQLGALVDAERSYDFAGKIADDLAAGAPKVAAGVEAGIIIPLQDGTETARHQAVDNIAKTPDEMAKALLAHKAEAADAMTALVDALKHPISRAKREAKIEGELASKALAQGLKSGDPYVRAQAVDTKNQLLDELHALETSAPGYGRRTAKAYADGLESEYGYLQGAVSKFLSGAKNQLKASSPPGPESPLHEIDKWGERTGRAWVEGMGKGIGSGGDFGLGEVASAFGGGSGGAKHATGGGGAASRGGDIHIHINGVSVMTPGSAQELARQLEPIITRAQQRQGHLAGARAF